MEYYGGTGGRRSESPETKSLQSLQKRLLGSILSWEGRKDLGTGRSKKRGCVRWYTIQIYKLNIQPKKGEQNKGRDRDHICFLDHVCHPSVINNCLIYVTVLEEPFVDVI